MKDNRPVNLDIGTIKLPLTAYVSILHRASGLALVVGVGILLWMLDLSLASEEGFASVKGIFDSFICKAIVWLVLVALIYHSVAGVKHLIMDVGIGETMEGGITGSKAVIVISIVLSVIVGAWIW